MNKLYKIIEDLCDSRGIDVQQLSKEIGIHRNVLPRLRANPEKDLAQKTREKIADYFNVPLDFLRPSGEPDPRDIPPEPELTDEQLLTAFWGKNPHKMTKDDLRRLKDLAKIMEMERAKSSNEWKGD